MKNEKGSDVDTSFDVGAGGGLCCIADPDMREPEPPVLMSSIRKGAATAIATPSIAISARTVRATLKGMRTKSVLQAAATVRPARVEIHQSNPRSTATPTSTSSRRV